MKKIFKEAIITLLLCIAICLILAIIFYEYMPTTKIVPSGVEKYSTADTIKDEIEQTTVDYTNTTTQNITFEITDTDLRLYKNSGSYSTGKANPFVASSTDVSNDEANGNNSNSEQDNSSSITVDKDSKGNSSGLK